MSRKPAEPVSVWDLPTRLFHWLLVALVGFSWWTGETGRLEWHFWSGYAVLALVLYRIVWGFVGSSTARFASFLRGPGAAWHHLRALLGPGTPRDLGHNAIGGWMVVLLLAVLLVQAGTGLFADDDILTTGPLAGLVETSTSQWLTTIHRLNFDLILILAGLHIVAVLAYLAVKRLDLIGPMVSGRKRAEHVPEGAAARHVSPLRALLVLAASGLAVWGIVSLG